LNAYFDALMVHGDPRISRLEDHFPWVEDIGIPVIYTGFVSEKLNGQQHLDHETRYVLVSAGGGAEGYAIAAPCVAAWKRLHAEGKVDDREMVIFSGLYVEDAHFEALQQMCAGGPFRLARFTSDFLQWMDGADLSISRAGYNTCMNVLETQTRAIFVPSIAMGDQEFRAQRLADLGLAQTISPDRVTPERISEAIFEGLNQPAPEHMLALDGAEQTRKLIENL
jgi:predicted glycosyltransferase